MPPGTSTGRAARPTIYPPLALVRGELTPRPRPAARAPRPARLAPAPTAPRAPRAMIRIVAHSGYGYGLRPGDVLVLDPPTRESGRDGRGCVRLVRTLPLDEFSAAVLVGLGLGAYVPPTGVPSEIGARL